MLNANTGIFGFLGDSSVVTFTPNANQRNCLHLG